MRWHSFRPATSTSITGAPAASHIPRPGCWPCASTLTPPAPFGSRTIEAARPSDVAGRYRCANQHPDRTSLCEFRATNAAAFQAAVVSVPPLAHHLRLTQVGTVSVEGTKLPANARKPAAGRCQRAGEMLAQLALETTFGCGILAGASCRRRRTSAAMAGRRRTRNCSTGSPPDSCPKTGA